MTQENELTQAEAILALAMQSQGFPYQNAVDQARVAIATAPSEIRAALARGPSKSAPDGSIVPWPANATGPGSFKQMFEEECAEHRQAKMRIDDIEAEVRLANTRCGAAIRAKSAREFALTACLLAAEGNIEAAQAYMKHGGPGAADGYGFPTIEAVIGLRSRALAAEARVKELEAKLTDAALVVAGWTRCKHLTRYSQGGMGNPWVCTNCGFDSAALSAEPKGGA